MRLPVLSSFLLGVRLDKRYVYINHYLHYKQGNFIAHTYILSSIRHNEEPFVYINIDLVYCFL